MSGKPNYYAILPANIRYDNRLNANEKIMYAEITALTQSTGQCWASNNYFAKLYDVTPQAISKWIKNIEKLGYINVTYSYKEGTKMIDKRYIVLSSIDAQQVSMQNNERYQLTFNPYQHTVEDNNTSNNNTSNNNVELDNSTNDKIPYKEIINYLNDKTGRNFRNVETNKKLIRARFNEGYTLEDFKYVVDVKYNEWKGTEYEKYLQPSTLFSTKFDGYVNQPLDPKPQYKTREPITKANRGGTFEHIKPD